MSESIHPDFIAELKLIDGEGADDIFEKKLPLAYKLIRDIFRTYLDMPSDDAHILVLWTILANYKDAFPTFPILFINASKGSGKTRLLKLLQALIANSIIVVSLSESALFRVAEVKSCILIDEAERLNSKEKLSLRELLNACYKRGGKVLRVEGDKVKHVREFDVYRAVALANIWGLDSILEDRCITIQMQKSQNQDIIALPELFDQDPRIQAINSFFSESASSVSSYSIVKVQGYYASLLQNMGINIHTYTPTPIEPNNESVGFFLRVKECKLDGRNLELWLPFLFLTYTIPTLNPTLTFKLAQERSKTKQEEALINDKDTATAQFLYTYCANSEELSNDPTPTIESKPFIKAYEDSEDKNDWLSSEWLGRFFRRIGVIVSIKRLNKGNRYRINLSKLREYLNVRGVLDEGPTQRQINLDFASHASSDGLVTESGNGNEAQQGGTALEKLKNANPGQQAHPLGLLPLKQPRQRS